MCSMLGTLHKTGKRKDSVVVRRREKAMKVDRLSTFRHSLDKPQLHRRKLHGGGLSKLQDVGGQLQEDVVLGGCPALPGAAPYSPMLG